MLSSIDRVCAATQVGASEAEVIASFGEPVRRGTSNASGTLALTHLIFEPCMLPSWDEDDDHVAIELQLPFDFPPGGRAPVWSGAVIASLTVQEDDLDLEAGELRAAAEALRIVLEPRFGPAIAVTKRSPRRSAKLTSFTFPDAAFGGLHVSCQGGVTNRVLVLELDFIPLPSPIPQSARNRDDLLSR